MKLFLSLLYRKGERRKSNALIFAIKPAVNWEKSLY